MTKNRANPQRSHPPGNPASPKPHSGAECPQMSGELKISTSPRRQPAVLSEAMDDPDKAIRLRAARYAMSFAVRVSETGKLKKDIRDLEDAVALSNAQHHVEYQNSAK